MDGPRSASKGREYDYYSRDGGTSEQRISAQASGVGFNSNLGTLSSVGSFRMSEELEDAGSQSTRKQLNEHFKAALSNIEDVRKNVIKQAEARARSRLFFRRGRRLEILCLLLLIFYMGAVVVYVFYSAIYWNEVKTEESDINHCTASPCANGRCLTVQDSYRCLCDAGFTGRRCQIHINFCEDDPCLNGGTCKNDRSTESFKLQAGDSTEKKVFSMSADSFFLPSQLTDNTVFYADYRDSDGDLTKAAIFGNTHNLLTWACFITKEQENPWVMVDLEEDAEIHQIDLHMRFDILATESTRRSSLPIKASVGFHHPLFFVDLKDPPGMKIPVKYGSASKVSAGTATGYSINKSSSPTNSTASSPTSSTANITDDTDNRDHYVDILSLPEEFPPNDANQICRPQDSEDDEPFEVLKSATVIRFRCVPPIVGSVVVVVAPTVPGETKRLELCEIRAYGKTVAEMMNR